MVSLDSLVHVYYHTVGRDTNLLIGMAIDTAELFPEKETQRLKILNASQTPVVKEFAAYEVKKKIK